ncbi:MAG: UTRA domain-containing protein, partial [Albidovulum sp.]
VILRKQKNGSFITSEENLPRDYVFMRFHHPESGDLGTVEFKSFSIAEISAPSPEQRFFGDGQPLLLITRDVEIEQTFLVRSEVYLADPRLRILLDLDPSTLKDLAIRKLLQTRFGMPSVRFEWRISMKVMSDTICADLGVAKGTLGLVAETEAYTLNDKKLMFQRMWIPPTKWKLNIQS